MACNWAVIALCVCLSGLPSTVQAAASSNETKARSQFRAAQKSYDLGEFAAALTHYAEAYRLQPLPAFLFNMAQCHRLLGNLDRAAFFYQRFLDLSPASSPSTQTARELLKDVQEKRQQQLAAAAQETPGAVPAPPPLSPPPLVEAPPVSLAPSQPPPQTESIPSPALSPSQAVAPRLTQRWWFWTAAGVAVVTAVAVGYVVATNPKPPSGTLADINAR